MRFKRWFLSQLLPLALPAFLKLPSLFFNLGFPLFKIFSWFLESSFSIHPGLFNFLFSLLSFSNSLLLPIILLFNHKLSPLWISLVEVLLPQVYCSLLLSQYFFSWLGILLLFFLSFLLFLFLFFFLLDLNQSLFLSVLLLPFEHLFSPLLLFMLFSLHQLSLLFFVLAFALLLFFLLFANLLSASFLLLHLHLYLIFISLSNLLHFELILHHLLNIFLLSKLYLFKFLLLFFKHSWLHLPSA